MADEHDLIVIGMGVGGEEVTGSAAGAGMDVLGIERKLVGGECAYWGCIPSKIMLRAGNTLAEAARATGLAGDVSISPSWEPVARRVRETTTDWNDEIAVERHEKRGAKVIRGVARFVGRKEVEVDGRRFAARRGVVIATGSEPSAPPIPGLTEIDYWTNREAIEATEVPESLLILGAGAVGVEFAQLYRRFGAKVTLVETAEHVLPAEEPENGDALAAALQAEGIDVHTNSAATKVKRSGGGVGVELADGKQLERERLLVATGRRPNIEALELDAAGVDGGSPVIDVDEHLRAADGIWAIGDVTGKAGFTHMSVYQGRIAVADVLGEEHAGADYSAVPRVSFTDPEVASVGLTEARARDEGLDVEVGVAKTSASSRGFIHGPGAEHGVMKVVADSGRGVLVGASVMGPAAGEVLGLLVLAVKEKIPIRALRELIYPYPTFVRGLEDPLRQVSR